MVRNTEGTRFGEGVVFGYARSHGRSLHTGVFSVLITGNPIRITLVSQGCSTMR